MIRNAIQGSACKGDQLQRGCETGRETVHTYNGQSFCSYHSAYEVTEEAAGAIPTPEAVVAAPIIVPTLSFSGLFVAPELQPWECVDDEDKFELV